jgi:hypothetical protein
VSERFELPASFGGALRYEDPDGDLISMSSDDEVQEALRLCGDGKTLKMTLNSVSSALGDFEMVESDSRPTSVCSSAAASQAAAGALKSAEEEGEALHLNSFKTHTLHLGRNIPIQPRPSQYWPGGYWGPPIHTDKVSHQMWMRFLQDTVRVLMPCCTIQDGIGIWKGEIEETKIISVTVDEGSLNAQDILNNIKAVGEEWKRQFHQEAVTLTTTPVSNFVLI